MKKIFGIAIAVILVASLTITCFAGTVNTIVFEYEEMNSTVIFGEDSSYSDTEKKYIADILVYGTSNQPTVQPRAWCWLTGHELTTEYVTVITHKVYTTAPRCVKERYKVVTCDNCDHEEMTLVSTTIISCCPVD